MGRREKKNKSMDRYKDRKYTIVAYDPTWAESFKSEADKIKTVFGTDAIAIEHIGSTSVPGMAGKPTIDVLVLVDNLELAEKHTKEMQNLGYEFMGQYVTQNSLLFRVTKNNSLLSNIHIFPKDHLHVKEMLDLRDFLKTHPQEVTDYSSLKEQLNVKYPNSYGDYRREKDEYMKELMRRVLNFYGR